MDSQRLHSFGDPENSEDGEGPNFSIRSLIEKSNRKDSSSTMTFNNKKKVDANTSELDEDMLGLDISQFDSIDYDMKKNRKQDSEFIGNEMNKKIQEKMDQMKLNKFSDDISIELYPEGDKSSFLDYTLDKSNVLVKKNLSGGEPSEVSEHENEETGPNQEEGGEGEHDGEQDAEGEESNIVYGDSFGGDATMIVNNKDRGTSKDVDDQEEMGEGEYSDNEIDAKLSPNRTFQATKRGDVSKIVSEPVKRGHKPSLSWIDETHNKMVAKSGLKPTNADTLGVDSQMELDQSKDNSRAFTFKFGDTSIHNNKTIMDGSVIIHGGNNPAATNTSVLEKSGFLNRGSEYNYYGDEEKGMTTQLNITNFGDITNNDERNESAFGTAKQASTDEQKIPLPTFGAFENMRKKLIEKKMRESGKTEQELEEETPTLPPNQRSESEDDKLSRFNSNTSAHNQSSLLNFQINKLGQSYMHHTTQDDFLNNEWERIINDIEKNNPDENEVRKKKEMVEAARKKYAKQIVNGQKNLPKNIRGGMINHLNQRAKKGAIPSHMIEQYNGNKDANDSFLQNDDTTKLANDIVFCLLLLESSTSKHNGNAYNNLIDKRMMHMNIISDYEIKK